MTTSDVVRAALIDVLGPEAVVTHRANHTGADKLSYEVLAGGEHLWVKVAAGEKDKAGLKAWASLAAHLAECHSAPPVLDTLEVAGRTGLIFPYVEAEVATRDTLHERYAEVKSVLDGLHADTDLAASLGQPTTSAAAFGEVWVSRFEADLEIVAGHITPELHDFFTAEVEALARRVDSLGDDVHVAMHGDPWHENVLLGHGRVWLLDWDDLSVGDPVVDDAILLMDAQGVMADWPVGARFEIARRALTLDAAVDGAADWVEQTDPAIRARKQQAYLHAVDAYRAFAASS